MDEGLQVEVVGGVLRVRFTRPEARNALSRAVCAGLRAALTRAAADDMLRAVVVEGMGGSFASGADLAELQELRGRGTELSAAYRELRAVQEQLYLFERPTLAAIDGYCLGAGLSLALACDLRIATPRSFFAAPPARLGLVYSDREVWRLMLRVGSARCRDLLFTGRRVAAVDALAYGLVERLVEVDQLQAGVLEVLADLSACAPRALRAAKQQLLRLEREGAPGLRGDELAEQALFDPDGMEGIASFLERRTPRFLP